MKNNYEPLKAFIVEDEALIAMDMQNIIEDAGHEVIGDAYSLNSFVEHPRRGEADLYLIDLQLEKETSGLDVAQEVKRDRDPLVIYVTANADLLEKDFGPGDGLIRKPITRRTFQDIISIVAEGEFDPPPSGEMPQTLTVSAGLNKRWKIEG